VHSARQAALLEQVPISHGDLAFFTNWNSPGDFTR
jgi:hypothetical protein